MGQAGNNLTFKRDIGLKLRNFREKLAAAINENKITTGAFGDMFGNFTDRQIQTYEKGKVEAPASLLYILWKNGNSIDALFAEGSISESGRDCALKLFTDSEVAQLSTMSQVERAKVYEGMKDAKTPTNETVEENAISPAKERKARTGKQSAVKKR